jgi:hypothetical protein
MFTKVSKKKRAMMKWECFLQNKFSSNRWNQQQILLDWCIDGCWVTLVIIYEIEIMQTMMWNVKVIFIEKIVIPVFNLPKLKMKTYEFRLKVVWLAKCTKIIIENSYHVRRMDFALEYLPNLILYTINVSFMV